MHRIISWELIEMTSEYSAHLAPRLDIYHDLPQLGCGNRLKILLAWINIYIHLLYIYISAMTGVPSSNDLYLLDNMIWYYCNGGYFSETSLHPKIPPARPRDPVIQIKPQAPKARGLIRIQVFVSGQKQGTVPQPRATA